MLKGKQIAVEGCLRQERWQDKETGKTRERVSIVANNVQLLGGKDTGWVTNNTQNTAASSQSFVPNKQPAATYEAPFDNGDNGDFPEDIPF